MKVLFLFTILITSLFAQEAEEIEVILGIDRIIKLDFKPSTKVEIGNESIMRYTIIPDDNIREVIFKGTKEGSTSVTIRNTTGEIKARYRVKVIATDQSRLVIKLREHLGEIEGLNIGIKGGAVVVEGKLFVPDDLGKAVAVIEREEFKDVLTILDLAPQAKVIIAKKMQDEIQKYGMKDVTVRVVNGKFWLEGFVTREGDKQLALKISESLYPKELSSLAERVAGVKPPVGPQILDFISPNIKNPPPPKPKLVKITAQFVELAKDYNRIFGFKWTPGISGDGGSISFGRTNDGTVSTNSSGTLSGTISNLFPKLASAKSAGNARVIQSGMIIVKNGTKDARITKNTTIPFSLGTGEFTRSQEAKAGFSLRITPNIIADENIEMAVSLNVSVTTAETPPKTISNDVSTTLVVKTQESAVVGGVAIQESSTAYDKDPPFGQDTFEDGTPLFSFIKSKSYTNNKTQFVVFVTPAIVESASQGTEEIKKKFRQRRRF